MKRKKMNNEAINEKLSEITKALTWQCVDKEGIPTEPEHLVGVSHIRLASEVLEKSRRITKYGEKETTGRKSEKKRKRKSGQKRTVDSQRLENHFKVKFEKHTYIPILLNLLEQEQSDKELARIALLIYESPYFISNDYHTFSSWYRNFCLIVGCDYNTNYTPCKLKADKKLRNKYYFLYKVG